jgi:5-methylcytosine-specific restriction protein A
MTGKVLNDNWSVGARHALFSKTGNCYHHLTRFPGVLFDLNGYLFFKTEQEYLHRTSLHISPKEIWVPRGISSAQGDVPVIP